jgi:hypothetical protein
MLYLKDRPSNSPCMQARSHIAVTSEGLLWKLCDRLESLLKPLGDNGLTYEHARDLQSACKSALSSLHAATRDAAALSYSPADHLVPGLNSQTPISLVRPQLLLWS